MNSPAPPLIQGSIVALVTPMQAFGAVDFAALKSLIDWHLAEKTDALVIGGTTGEASTLSLQEHCALIEQAVAYANGRMPVIAGTGANATSEAILLGKCAKKAGAAASLVVTPYYNRPSQQGLLAHFAEITKKVDLPMILYNVPSRTGVDLHNEAVLTLAEQHGIIGIKDATGDMGRGMQLIAQAPPQFAVYSGDDMTAALLMLMGAKGNISVTANIAPHFVHLLCAAAFRGDVAQVRAVQFKLLRLHQLLFCESNPVPVKWALAQMGKINRALRLPLTPLNPIYHSKLNEVLQEVGALSA